MESLQVLPHHLSVLRLDQYELDSEANPLTLQASSTQMMGFGNLMP